MCECDCGSIAEEEDGTAIHFEDCAILNRLVKW